MENFKGMKGVFALFHAALLATASAWDKGSHGGHETFKPKGFRAHRPAGSKLAKVCSRLNRIRGH